MVTKTTEGHLVPTLTTLAILLAGLAVLADGTPSPSPGGAPSPGDLPGWVAALVAVAIVGLVVALLARMRRSSRLRE